MNDLKFGFRQLLKNRGLTAVAACFLGFVPLSAAAAIPDAPTREQTVQAINQLLRDRYVYPEVAAKMADALSERLKRGDFDSIADGSQLAQRLTEELQAVSRDRHIRVEFHAEARRPGGNDEEPNPDERREAQQRERRDNSGFDKVEVLPGNVGLIRFNFFGDEKIGGERMAGAMRFLQDTDALILDLQRNGGGNPAMVQVVCSYFFPDNKTHLNSLYWREGNRTNEFWTLAGLPAPRYLNKPVYVLTSGRTFSGAEECAYNLQTRKRATIVGATTGGGANPGRVEFVSEHFSIFVPNGRAINPVTGTNWEGVGVKPDVEAVAGKALLAAHKLALEAIVPCYAQDARWQELLRSELRRLNDELSRKAPVTEFSLHGFADAKQVSLVGPFNEWTPGATKLERRGDVWQGRIELEPGRHLYKFFVDGQWLVDPNNSEIEVDPGGHTNSVQARRRSVIRRD